MTAIMPFCKLAQAAIRFGNMSLSRETIEQLLSGYMDDALGDDERNQVEELLRTDSEVAGELKELRRLRESLQFIAKADSMIRLESGFADRVLDAAVRQARAEGLSEDHPVMRLSEQPSTSSSLGSSGRLAPLLRVTGIVAALAASVAIALVYWRPTQSQEADIQPLAKVESIPDSDEMQSPKPEAALAESGKSDLRSEALSSERSSGPSQSDMLVDTAIASGDRVNTKSKASIAVDRDEAANDRLASSSLKPKSSKTSDIASPSPTKIDSTPQRIVGAVMVVDITRTAAGRMSRAVRRAMNATEIKIQNEKLIAEDIVGVLESSDHSDDESLAGAAVFYLEATAKQLDQFMLSLCNDEQGIDTIRFGLATELPILNLVQKLQRPIDPKTVRHSASWSVQGETPAASRLLTGALVDQPMRPYPKNRAALNVNAGAKEDGPDVMSELLVIVR